MDLLTASLEDIVASHESLTPDTITKGLAAIYEAVPTTADADAREALKAKAEYLEDVRAAVARKAALNSPAPVVSSDQPAPYKSALEEFVASDAYKSWIAGGLKGSSAAFTKDLYETEGDNLSDRFSGPAGDLVTTLRRPSFVADPENATFLWELANPMPINDGSYEYIEETVVGDATFVPERNSSDTDYQTIGNVTFAYQAKQIGLEWVAAMTRVSIRALRNTPSLLARLEARLAQRVALALDNALINGTGTGSNPTGLLNAGIGTYVASPGESVVEAIINAIAEQRSRNYMPTVAVFDPTTWAKLKTTKDSVGRFQNLDLGVPTFISNFVPENTVLLGDFANGVDAITRGGLEIFVTDKPDNLSIKNATAVVARIEANFAVVEPGRFTAVDITNATTYVPGAPSGDEGGSGGDGGEA